MLTQLFRDSEAAQCHLLTLIASTSIHSSVRSFYSPFTLIFSHRRLFLGSLPDYGMVPVVVTSPALFTTVVRFNLI